MKIELLDGLFLIGDLEKNQIVLVNNEVVRFERSVNDYSFVGQSLEHDKESGRFICETPFIRKATILEDTSSES